MAMHDYLDINSEDIPMSFSHEIDGVNYNLDIYYNDVNDAYYISIYDENNVPIVLSEKIVYGEILFGKINDPRLPLVNIVPFDENENESEVNKLNFTKTVQLYFMDSELDDSDDDDEDTDDSDNDDVPDINDYGNDETVGDN